MSAGAILGIGTATFAGGYGIAPNTPTSHVAVALLCDAFAAGIRYVDTAAAYGDAESVVGQLAQQVGDCGVRVCTKVNAAGVRAETVIAQVQASLARLKLDAVDTVLLHSVDAATLVDRAFGRALHQIVAENLAMRTGASTYGAADARVALEQSWCGALQVEHSILNSSVVSTLEPGRAGVEIVARSVLCKGLLTERRWRLRDVAAELAPTFDALERMAAEWSWPLPELAIRYALDSPGVDVAVVGVSSESELLTALSAAARPSLGAEAHAMLAAFDRSKSDATHPERWNALVAKEA